ncbi:MAG: FAD-dependent oxidoreductase [Euryarchaeota archaeon]|nr:FAD-dependent oxidoreductase [Euryarchaeota archaeon]
MTKINVGIIGGGLSGLIAAYELQKQLKNDVKVTILEKEPRLGGRIFSKEFQNCPIELGAQFFIHGGEVHNLVKLFNLESEVIFLHKNFISFNIDKKIVPIDDITTIDLFKSNQGIHEKQKLFQYLKKITFTQELLIPSFEEWYRKNIGDHLLSFWNRMLISIGVRDISSINAYFGLTLINVFFGDNYLIKTGLNQLIGKISESIISSGGTIMTNTKCINLQKIKEKFYVEYQKDNNMKEEMTFQKVISAVTPSELLSFYKINLLKPLNVVDSHPMTLYVITSDTLWDFTWGLIICDEKSPIYALCDWRNIVKASKNTPILAICSPFSAKDEVIAELRRLFPFNKTDYKVIYEKKWSVGLHQCNENFYKIPREIIGNLSSGFYLAGDWMVLPALEGAVVSGKKVAKLLIKNL